MEEKKKELEKIRHKKFSEMTDKDWKILLNETEAGKKAVKSIAKIVIDIYNGWEPIQKILEQKFGYKEDIPTLLRLHGKALERAGKELDISPDTTWDKVDWEKINPIVVKYFIEEFTKKELEKPDFDKVWEKVQTMTTIPVDYDLFKKRQLYFPFPPHIKLVKKETLKTGEHLERYEVENIMEKMVISFVLPPGVDPPKFRKRAMSIFFSMLPFAKAQSTSEPFIKREHQYKLLGKKRGYYSRIDDVLRFLTMGYWDYSNKAKGKEYRREIGHLVNNVKWYGGGRGSYYQVSINSDIIKTFTAILEGKTGKDIPQHISYPIQVLTYEPNRETRLIEYLFEKVQGFRKPYPRQVKTILKQGMGITQKEIDTNSLLWLAGELDRGLRAIEKQSYTWELTEKDPFHKMAKVETIKRLGFKEVIKKLKSFKELKFKKDIFLKWKILIKLSEIPEAQKLKLTPEGSNLVEELLEWHYGPGTNFNIKNPRERTKAQIENTIKTLGMDRVKEIVKEMNRVDPNPRYFWKKVKYYKRILKIKSL